MAELLPHRVQCTSCGFRYRLKTEQLGKRLRCQSCKQPFVAVDSDAAAAANALEEIEEDDFLSHIPPEPKISQATVYQPQTPAPTAGKFSVPAMPKLPGLPAIDFWWLGTNRVEVYAVLACVVLLLLGLIVSGDTILFCMLPVMVVASIEFFGGILTTLRACVRNGASQLTIVIIFVLGCLLLYVLAQVFSSHFDNRRAAIRTVRGVALIILAAVILASRAPNLDANSPARHYRGQAGWRASAARLV